MIFTRGSGLVAPPRQTIHAAGRVVFGIALAMWIIVAFSGWPKRALGPSGSPLAALFSHPWTSRYDARASYLAHWGGSLQSLIAQACGARAGGSDVLWPCRVAQSAHQTALEPGAICTAQQVPCAHSVRWRSSRSLDGQGCALCVPHPVSRASASACSMSGYARASAMSGSHLRPSARVLR